MILLFCCERGGHSASCGEPHLVSLTSPDEVSSKPPLCLPCTLTSGSGLGLETHLVWLVFLLLKTVFIGWFSDYKVYTVQTPEHSGRLRKSAQPTLWGSGPFVSALPVGTGEPLQISVLSPVLWSHTGFCMEGRLGRALHKRV